MGVLDGASSYLADAKADVVSGVDDVGDYVSSGWSDIKAEFSGGKRHRRKSRKHHKHHKHSKSRKHKKSKKHRKSRKHRRSRKHRGGRPCTTHKR